MPEHEPLIPTHGGFRRLRSFAIAQLVFDVTVRFCELYVERHSRTRDQMVQAARSGVQNIAEGSQASGTSKKTELKLTNVARASLEELRLDYEDFLRQRDLVRWPPEHPALARFKALRCTNLEQVRAWVEQERQHGNSGHGNSGHGNSEHGNSEHGHTDEHGLTRTNTDSRTDTERHGRGEAGGAGWQSRSQGRPPSSAELVANAALSLLNVCCYLLDRQLASLAAAFERDGGITERLYRVRSANRQRRS